MEDGALGCALLIEDGQDVVVGVAIVDDQGAVGALGQVDVPAKRFLLHGPAFGGRAEVVQAGLAHRAHATVVDERLDRRPRLLQRHSPAALDEARCLIGVQGHAGHHRRVRARERDRRARGLNVAADLHDPGDAHLRGCGQQLVRVGQVTSVQVDVVDVEVRVRVGDRAVQRLGRLGGLRRAGHA